MSVLPITTKCMLLGSDLKSSTTSPIRVLFTHRELDTTIHNLAWELAKLPGFEVYMTTLPWVKKHQSGGIIYLPLSNLSSKFSPKAIWQLRQYCREYQFDIIYSVSSSGLSNALFASWGSKCINVGYRGTGAKVRRLDPTYYLGVLNPRVKHIVCENAHIEQYLTQFIPRHKLSTATKPFMLEWVEEAKSKPIIPKGAEEGLRIVSVGNTKGRPHKGLRTLIEAINHLSDTSLQVVLVGDYDTEDYDLAMSSNVSNNYHFIGSSPKAMNYIAGADIYILPSYRDASPRVVREAMALGLPTIVSNIEGSRDLIEEGTSGLLFEARNYRDLAEKIRYLQDNPTLRQSMGNAGIERIRTAFDFSNYSRYFIELFTSLKRN